MQAKDFNEISMNGRMAYLILCVESYVKAVYPDKDWTVLSQWMWNATSEYWDEWDSKFMEIIPEFLFECDSYEESDFECISEDEYEYFTSLFDGLSDEFNNLMLKLHELQQVYCYESIPGRGTDASKIIVEACNILEHNDIVLPDPEKIAFSRFLEKDGWGNDFDGTELSLILNP